MNSDVLFLILAGAVTVFVVAGLARPRGLEPGGIMSNDPADASDWDAWQTPYYLRYNMPAPGNGVRSLMPIPANYTYALGIPAAPYTQATVTA